MPAVKGRPVVRTKAVGLRNKAWWVLRKNKSMTICQIQASICDGSEGDSTGNLRGWLNDLVKAGLFSRALIPDGKLNSNGSYEYRILKDLGAKAPVVQKSKGVIYDPNTGNTYPLQSDKAGDL